MEHRVAERPRTQRLRNVSLVAASIGLVCGAVFAFSPDAPASGEEPFAPPGPARGQDWAQNENGQTYGSLGDARSPAEEPDLILVGIGPTEFGYVTKEDLSGPIPRTLEEAAQLTNEPARSRSTSPTGSRGSGRSPSATPPSRRTRSREARSPIADGIGRNASRPPSSVGFDVMARGADGHPRSQVAVPPPAA